MTEETDGKMLLHACCAPCSVAIIEELKRSERDLTVFFYNPNIFPESEYLKRKAEVIRACVRWGIQIVDCDYENEIWESEISDIPQETEGGSRCSACIRQRLLKAAQHAKDNGFSLFATSLSSGRQKRSEVINAIGQAVSGSVGVPFMAEDWKKAGRQERGLELVREMEIYRQRYCGCRHSLAEKEDTEDTENQE